MVSVHLPPFWSSSCPSLLHKAVETSGGPVTQTWPEDDCLSRRYHCVQSDSGGNIAGQGLNPLVTSEFGFCNQLEEISVRSFTLHGVPRLCDKFNGNELIIAKGKNESTHPVLQRPDLGKNCLRQNPSQNNWETDFVNAGCSPCTLALPTLANVASERSASRKELRDNGITQPELSERPSMVGGSDFHLEWSVNNYSSTRPGNNDRCITAGLGSSLPRGSHEGTLSQQESNTLHINALELKAALFAVRAFTAKERQLHVHLRMDNRTAVAYVLKMGGTRSSVLVGIAQELWGYALTKQITLTAEYLPGKYNHKADWESRHFRDSSNWKLNPSIFQALDQLWGPLEIDLFADRLNAQLMNYVSWFPDPFAQATDAFQIPWSKLKGYSFPPFSMICRCLAKIKKDQATIVMITPTWHTQAWYPVLLEMSCRQPVLLPPLENILMSPSQKPHPLVLQGSLQLVAWMVSGKTSLQKEFQSKLLSYSAPTPGARELRALTIAPGHSGVAGVIREKLIHFAPLWPL